TVGRLRRPDRSDAARAVSRLDPAAGARARFAAGAATKDKRPGETGRIVRRGLRATGQGCKTGAHQENARAKAPFPAKFRRCQTLRRMVESAARRGWLACAGARFTCARPGRTLAEKFGCTLGGRSHDAQRAAVA